MTRPELEQRFSTIIKEALRDPWSKGGPANDVVEWVVTDVVDEVEKMVKDAACQAACSGWVSCNRYAALHENMEPLKAEEGRRAFEREHGISDWLPKEEPS